MDIEKTANGEKMKRVAITGGCGYIGSALTPVLSEIEDCRVDILDMPDDYRQLAPERLRRYDAIVHLAAHSSVGQCEVDPLGALQNNIVGFVAFIDALRSNQTLIYASSGSVYHGCGCAAVEECCEVHPRSLYDITKSVIDQICVIRSRSQTYGLRLGTVSGPSSKMRWELMINAMVADAKRYGCVRVQNGDAFRSILGMKDLTHVVRKLLGTPQVAAGIYNVASRTMRISEIGKEVAEFFGVRLVIDETESPHYDFGMSTRKLCAQTGFEFEETVSSICRSIADANLPLPIGK